MLRFTWLYILTPLVIFFFTAIQIEEGKKFVTYILSFFGDVPKFLIGVFTLFFIIQYINQFLIPEKKFKRAKAARDKLLKRKAAHFTKTFATKNIDIKFNIMSLRRAPFGLAYLLPNSRGSRRISFFPKIFKCVWTSEDHFLPKNFRLHKIQGTSGNAVKTNESLDPLSKKARIMILNVEGMSYEMALEEMKLNKKQYKEISNLTLLASLPIKIRSRKNPNEYITVGTITAESRTPAIGMLLASASQGTGQVTNQAKSWNKLLGKSMHSLREDYEELYF